jgi:hypothetical protein
MIRFISVIYHCNGTYSAGRNYLGVIISLVIIYINKITVTLFP